MNAAARFVSQGMVSRGWVMTFLFTKKQIAFFILLLMSLSSALSVVYVTNSTRSLNANLQQVISDREKLHLQWGQLLLEESTLTTQARIQDIAENKLGMLIPDQKSMVIINE